METASNVIRIDFGATDAFVQIEANGFFADHHNSVMSFRSVEIPKFFAAFEYTLASI